jgi:hypothetical protein
MFLGKFTRCCEGAVVDRFENLNIQFLCLGRVKWKTEGKESVGETLNTQGDRSMTEVTPLCLLDWVVVKVNYLIQVTDDDLGDLVQFAKIILATDSIDEGRQNQGSKVADCHLISRSILDNLSTKIGASDSAQILLVTLAVAGVFVEHERGPSLGLGY